MIVWGPGLIASDAVGTTVDEPVFSAIDVNRSLYAIADVLPPVGAPFDGEDVSRTLLGEESNGRQAPIFFRRPPDRPGFSHGLAEDNPDLAVRDGRWKYLVNYDRSTPQLYDLDRDIAESNNLAGDHLDVARRLHEALMAWNAMMPPDAGANQREPRE